MVGTVNISVEVELGWGVHDSSSDLAYWQLDESGDSEREAMEWFLDICERYDVEVTFDIVGHLLLEECSGRHDGPHKKGWFDEDPGQNEEEAPLFFSPDLISQIHESPVDHEICTHTFSHVECGKVSKEVVDWELKQARDLHQRNNLGDPKSLVPPRHSPPPKDILKEQGIENIRMPIESYGHDSALPRSLWILRRTHPTYEPEIANGVVTSYCTPHPSLTAPYLSRGIAPAPKKFRTIPKQLRQIRHQIYLQSGLKRAISEDSYVHFWTHLYNLNSRIQRAPINSFFETLATKRAEGSAEIRTMASLGTKITKSTKK